MHQLPVQIIEAIEAARVPSPPQMLLRLLQMVDDDRTTMAQLAAVVEKDPGLCTRVLMVANSPALRRGNQLLSLENCLVALGTRLIRSIATCLSVQSMFERRNGIAQADLANFWSHSLLVAELARGIATASAHPRPDEAYLAGLLHDIGQLILLGAMGGPYAQLLSNSEDEDALYFAEKESLNVHHGEIGTWLVDQWQLESTFGDGILFHHATPEEILTADTLPQIVWLAHVLSRGTEITSEITELASSMLGNKAEQGLASIRDQAVQRMTSFATALGIPTPVRDANGCYSSMPRPKEAPGPQASSPEEALEAMVNSMAALQPLQQDLFALDSNAEILISLRESARILFDINRLAFLLCDSKDGKLTGREVGGQPPIFRQVSISLEAQRSLAVSAAVSRQIRSTFDNIEHPLSLIDAQFARALSSPGLLCVPMVTREKIVGVMVCGLSATHHARLAKRLPWLLNFGRIAAISLEALLEAQTFRNQAESAASEQFTRQARRVAHEAGNPLSIIKSYLKILDKKLPEEADVRQELSVLTEEIDRVADIVRRMSDVPKTQPAGPILDIGELLQELLVFYGDTLFRSKGIGLKASAPKTSLPVTCDRNSTKQILLNLWKNASEALEQGKQFSITLSENVVHNGTRYVEARMEDNGPGIPEAALRRLQQSEPATDNAPRGMGLSIVGALAAKEKILVTCRTQSGQGTSISLLFPSINPTSIQGEK
jgi:HD-like signal output (HDOD) protein/nitrogen-specific signal transduction histidine kinase